MNKNKLYMFIGALLVAVIALGIYVTAKNPGQKAWNSGPMCPEFRSGKLNQSAGLNRRSKRHPCSVAETRPLVTRHAPY
jgi:hypothetical protein